MSRGLIAMKGKGEMSTFWVGDEETEGFRRHDNRVEQAPQDGDPDKLLNAIQSRLCGKDFKTEAIEEEE